MRNAIGTVLVIVGLGWAAMGAWSCTQAVTPEPGEAEKSDAVVGVVGMVSGAIFVLPGLVVAGIGAIATGRKS